MLGVLGWGLLAASSLALGALLGVVHPWPDRLIGLVLGSGGGALVSAVSFQLAGEGLRQAGLGPVAVGMAPIGFAVADHLSPGLTADFNGFAAAVALTIGSEATA
jgi:zinc transporter, ZIP family